MTPIRSALFLLMLGLSTSAFAQHTAKWAAPASATVEAGVGDYHLSANFSLLLYQTKWIKYGLSLGVGSKGINSPLLYAPVQGSLLLGHVESFLEVSAGLDFNQSRYDDDSKYLRPVDYLFKVGYKFLPVEEGFTWGMAVVPSYRFAKKSMGDRPISGLEFGFSGHVGYAFGNKRK